MAKTARDVMTQGAECADENDTFADVAKRLVELGVGAMPICGEDNRLKGMITDRDIVVEGKDAADVKAGELGGEEVVTIGADDSVDEALSTLKGHKVRRLPVIDGQGLVGMVSLGDLAQNVEESQLGDVVEAITAAP